MQNRIFLGLILCLCVLAAGCQTAQDIGDNVEDLADAPLTNPTKNELEAVKSICDDAANAAEAGNCAKREFEKIDGELNQLLAKITLDLQKFAEKAVSQDKTLAEKYKKDAVNLTAAQKAWTSYREANCLAEREANLDAANAVFVEFGCRGRITEDRIEDLKFLYENK